MTKKIELVGGGEVLVDDEDFENLNQFKWIKTKGGGNTIYAIRTVPYASKSGRYIVRMHRVIMGMCPKDGRIVDHVDGNGLNNCRSNLRITSNSVNCQNQRSRTKKNRTGFIGVTEHKRGKIWRAEIGVNMNRLFLGMFGSPTEAGQAYDKAALFYFGKHAKINFPIELYPVVNAPSSIMISLSEDERKQLGSSIEDVKYSLFGNSKGCSS